MFKNFIESTTLYHEVISLKHKEVESLLSALDRLLEIKVLIRNTVPDYNLDEAQQKQFLELLETLKSELMPIFSRYLKQEALDKISEVQKQLKQKVIESIQNKDFILVSSNSTKKELKNRGADPRYILVSGGPLFIDDFKVVNPNIPENALKNIKRKLDQLFSDLKNQDWTNKDLVFIGEKENITDKLIWEKREKISEFIGKPIKAVMIESWDALEI